MDGGDKEQVSKQEGKLKLKRKQELADIKAVLETPHGKRVFWKLLEHCGVFSSLMERGKEFLEYNSGKQDVGHFIMAEIVASDELAMLEMMKLFGKVEEDGTDD